MEEGLQGRERTPYTEIWWEAEFGGLTFEDNRWETRIRIGETDGRRRAEKRGGEGEREKGSTLLKILCIVSVSP